MIKAILGLLAIITVGFTKVYAIDFKNNKDSKKKGMFGTGIIIGFITDFLDAIGVGSFATTTGILKLNNKIQISDKLLPGTLNVAHTLPMIVEAFMSLTVISVDMTTLICMIVAAVLGSWIGAGVISKLPEKKVQITMGIALIGTAILILLGQFKLMPAGGDAIALTGVKLILGMVGNFILGALMTAGIGLYAPCMAMVALLGMDPKAAFPIMMGACAFLGPIASIKFVKEGAYEREISMGITIGGVVGAILALSFVTSMPTYWLKWLVVAVVIYTAVTMLTAGLKKEDVKLGESDKVSA